MNSETVTVEAFADACEALYRRMHRNRTRASARRTVATELSDAEFAVVTPLVGAGDGLTVGRLAEVVGVSSPTLSRSLSRLEGAGLVTRTRLGAGHQVEVSVTAAGRAAWREARARAMERQGRALDLLPPDRRAPVIAALRELAAAIDAAEG